MQQNCEKSCNLSPRSKIASDWRLAICPSKNAPSMHTVEKSTHKQKLQQKKSTGECRDSLRTILGKSQWGLSNGGFGYLSSIVLKRLQVSSFCDGQFPAHLWPFGLRMRLPPTGVKIPFPSALRKGRFESRNPHFPCGALYRGIF